jgi:hypothetical protein
MDFRLPHFGKSRTIFADLQRRGIPARVPVRSSKLFRFEQQS